MSTSAKVMGRRSDSVRRDDRGGRLVIAILVAQQTFRVGEVAGSEMHLMAGLG